MRAIWLSVAAACGGSRPPPAPVVTAPAPVAPRAAAPPPRIDPAAVPLAGRPRDRAPRAQVWIGPTTVGAGGDPDAIHAVVRAHLEQVRACYQPAVERDPGLAGTVTVRFTIAADGRVAGAAATGVTPEVAGCIEVVVGALRFAPPAVVAAVDVVYPFALRPPP